MSKHTFSENTTWFLKALANEKRQQIMLEIFGDGQEHNITEVAEKAQIAQSTASEHCSLLKRAGILVSHKVEKEVFYQLDRESIIAHMDEIRSLLKCCL
jgi:DNA-binding transcriptional ArsR family regulator